MTETHLSGAILDFVSTQSIQRNFPLTVESSSMGIRREEMKKLIAFEIANEQHLTEATLAPAARSRAIYSNSPNVLNLCAFSGSTTVLSTIVLVAISDCLISRGVMSRRSLRNKKGLAEA